MENINKFTKLLFLIPLVFFASCLGSSKPHQIVFEMPNNFQGVFVILKAKKIKPVKLNKIPSPVIIKIPEKGIAYTDSYQVFHEWHQTIVKSNNEGESKYILFGLGEVNGNNMYFYGDENTYETKIRFTNPTDLKIGRMD